MDLDIIRQEIDQIDDQIVQLLEERMHLVEGVVAYIRIKQSNEKRTNLSARNLSSCHVRRISPLSDI